MPPRMQFQSSLTISNDLQRLLEKAKNDVVSEETLREQRVSFAFGNAPESDFITKESVRLSSRNIRLIAIQDQ